jgi:uncharacterized protein YhaN
MSTTWTPATHQRPDTRERLAFTTIEVDRAPGISPGFTIEGLSPDINIIFGPNASGKSTTARAIQALIWPHPSSLRGHHLRAEFDLGDEHWEIDADAGRVTRSQDGQPAVAPVVAPIDDRVRYTLSLHDLLASENQPMAQAILKESSGGFDLDIIAEHAGYRADIPPRLESARNVESALARLRDAERVQGEIAAQARQLTTLREQERVARLAIADAEALRKAIHFAQVRHDHEQARQRLAIFPQGLAQAKGDEPDRIEALNGRLAELHTKRTELERNREAALADLEATNLKGTSINEGVIAALRQHREDLRRLDAEMSALHRDLKSAVSERESHQRRLAADLSDAQMASLDTEGIRELAGLAHAYEDIRARRRARDEVEQWIGTVTPPENVDTLRAGIDALSKRLQNPNREEAGAIIGRARAAAYIGGLLVVASAIWLANFVAWPWIFLAILGLLIIFFAWKYALPESVKEAALWEDRYRALDLPEPASWTLPAIRDHMNELQQELRVALVEQEKANRWSHLEQERIDLDRAYTETEARRSKAVAQYGVAPDLKEESLQLLADNLGRWQVSDTAVRSTEARLGQVAAERLKLETTLREELNTYGYDDPDFDEHIEDLDQRYRSLRDASARAETLAQEMGNAIAPEIDQYEEARAAIFRQVDLEPGQESELRARIGQLPGYREAQRAINEIEQALRDAANALSLTPHLRNVDPDDLQQLLEEAESATTRLDPVMHEIAEIRTRISDAKKRREIEGALGNRDDALNALRHDREEVGREIAGQTLLTYIQHETRDAAMPIVFHRARELFSIITRGRYELEFEEGPPPAFTARDTSTGAMLHLDQLSSGTRVQVLMAIRLAFVENVETGPKLPVILDETLGNSDELRAGAIIDAAIEISRKGRQVFYFTAQGDEVARWQARLDQIPAGERPATTIIDLGDVRREAGFDRLPMTAPKPAQETRVVTAPDSHDRDAYGELIKVPGLDLWSEERGGIHLWHVVDDLATLHRLLEQDVQTWGQLSGIVRSTGVEGLSRLGVDEGVYASAGAKIRLLETAITMWRIGHARPVSIREIADSGVVDPVVLEELGEILESAGNDGSSLIEALRASDDPPLSEQTTDRLEAWLISEGFIAQGEAMSRTDLRARMLESARDVLDRGLLTDADIDEMLRRLPE